MPTRGRGENMIGHRRGSICQTRELTSDGLTTKLKSKYIHHVLLLDTYPAKEEYIAGIAVDSLNSFGWVTFDDIKAVLGEKSALKVVKYSEERNAKVAAEMKKDTANVNTDTKASKAPLRKNRASTQKPRKGDVRSP